MATHLSSFDVHVAQRAEFESDGADPAPSVDSARSIPYDALPMKAMIHGDFKPGEVCRETGEFECRTCKARSVRTTIRLEKGSPFPECAACTGRGVPEVDVIWKICGATP